MKNLFVLCCLFSFISCGNDLYRDTGYIAEDERDALLETENESTRGNNQQNDIQNTSELEQTLEDNISNISTDQTHIHDQDDNASGILNATGHCEGTSLLKDIITYGDMIKNLGGSIEAPLNYDKDFVGFQKFLSDSGIKHFNSLETGTPGSKSYAKECGLKHLIPARACWLRVASLLLTGDKIRSHLDSKVIITSLYRPACYNKKVKGTAKSDHLTARSMDLSFFEKEKRKLAADFICQNFWKDDLYNLSPDMNSSNIDDTLNISIGLGGTYMHIGLSSPQGRRYWVYNSYVKAGGQANNCWNRP